MLGNISESVSEFEQALVISPYNINALIKLGTTLLNNNKVSDAVRVLEKGLEKNLENPELLRFLAIPSTILGPMRQIIYALILLLILHRMD